MQRNTHRLLAAAFAMAGLSTAGAQEIDSVVKKLQATNTITLGYRETLLPTSYLDDQKKPTGYAIEMCMRILDEVKAELKLPQIKVEYVPVNIQNRQALVANGTVQLECGGRSTPSQRNKQVDFSPSATSRQPAARPEGLAHRQVRGSQRQDRRGGHRRQQRARAQAHHRDEQAERARHQRRRPRAGLIAVESRRADAYFNDNAAFFSLIKQVEERRQPRVVGPEYGYSPQGFMVPKNNPTFLWIVNHAMGKMFKSGEAEKIFDKWFGPFGAKVSPKLRAAWETASYPE
jgi:glutamate/aspartate transport system substrate-binding protein